MSHRKLSENIPLIFDGYRRISENKYPIFDGHRKLSNNTSLTSKWNKVKLKPEREELAWHVWGAEIGLGSLQHSEQRGTRANQIYLGFRLSGHCSVWLSIHILS